jgi:hypothetical protein
MEKLGKLLKVDAGDGACPIGPGTNAKHTPRVDGTDLKRSNHCIYIVQGHRMALISL